MHRLMKALLLMVAFVLIGQAALSQPIVQVSGRLPQGALRVFTKDTLYQVIGQYTVSGMLLIEPGTTVEFLPNGRLIDSVGGRIIADGELQATWNGNTSVGSFANGYCDPGFILANVAIGGRPEISAPGPNWTNYAPLLLFYHANGLSRCATDPNLRNRVYRRNVVRAPIVFRGRPISQYSREWGHIVVLPGADSVIFRNCQFVNFRKDTTVVQSTDFFAPNNTGGYNAAQVAGGNALNILMRQVTSGGGGAITVFSSKTWILNCRFDSNFARYHGGAVQFLQAPFDPSGQFYLPAPGLPVSSTAYPPIDPELYDTYGGTNSGDSVSTPFGKFAGMMSTSPSNPAVSQFRQTYDDGRMAINKGRVRRLYFRDNRAVVSDVVDNAAGYRDVITTAPIYPVNGIRKNEAYGGAVYVSGRRGLTVFFGRALGDQTDTVVCERNYAVNYQSATGTNGARGGAFFIGDSSSMVFRLSRFADNFTAVPNIGEANYALRSQLSQGGGIYMSRTSPTLTIQGNVDFRNNKSAQGGAIYVSAIAVPTNDPFLSPSIIGDSVYFVGNKAEYDGGAIYTQRNVRIDVPLLTSVDLTAPGTPTVDHRAVLDSNGAGLSGGAIVVDNQTNSTNSTARIERVIFSHNAVGDSSRVTDTRLIKLYDPVANPFTPANQYGTWTVSDSFRMASVLHGEVLGGGAIYSFRGNTNFFRSVEFSNNWTVSGNGGAIAMVVPITNNRYFLSAGDSAYDFTVNSPTAFVSGPEPTDQRQMTRFIRNRAIKDPFNTTFNSNPRVAQGTTGPLDPGRNGTGLGGAIYLNDLQPTNPTPGAPRTDSVIVHRVRMEQDTAYTGSAIYSPNYDLRIVMNKSLVTGNVAVSTEGIGIDSINNASAGLGSQAASLTASATFFGDIEGPMASTSSAVNANAIYDNQARFWIRLPDAPQGGFGTGASGVDTLRGNFWGEVQAPVTTVLPSGTIQNTFYVQGLGCTLPLKNAANVNEQGPFESPRQIGEPSNFLYSYTPIPVYMIPDTLLFEGRVYDIFDKGRDIKSVDYSSPRMAPIEDFSVGIPRRLSTYATGVHAGKVVRRLTRDPFVAAVDPAVGTLQREFVGNHPIGYPLFLESNANYAGMADTSNNDAYALNYTTFLVINVETGEFIRTNLKQVTEGSTLYRSRVEFVADSINRDPLERRSREGRAAFSIGELYRLSPRFYLETPGQLPSLATRLDSVKTARFYAARFEDSVAVAGRRYGALVSELGGNGFRFTNRPTSPTFADIYAGERYHALPVKTGDRIWVISRTMLWNMSDSLVTVLNNARFTGLQFSIDTIGNSVAAPLVYGQRNQLEQKTPIELRNTRFLNEDVVYPSDTTGRSESKIFEVTASDPNGFFDPRSIYFPNRYTGLNYEWTPLQELTNGTTIPTNDPKQVRLASWLKTDLVYPANNKSTRDSAHARGFLRFYGTPHNPDVVPGGELVELKVSNYPPGVRTIDSLRGLVSIDSLSKWIYIYPPYFNCQTYDPTVARYLEQDTVDVGGATTTSYRFRIFVQDSTPVFQADGMPCTFPNLPPNTVVANLTNKLRFDFDVNTDDESEDSLVAVNEGWDFRYGRTAYGFVFTDRNYGGGPGNETDDVEDVRPTWMGDSYLLNDNKVADQGANFMQFGKIVVRIDSATAINLLRNPAQFNSAFNLDSVFTVVANDGHTGQNKRDMRVLVNVAPQLQPLVQGGFALPNAKEDYDYNPAMLDSTRRIPATDLNFNQRLRYYLVYSSDADNDARWQTGFANVDSTGAQVVNTATLAYVRRDGCYTDAGLFQAPKTTPSWLKINPISGLLYGTPGLNDAPKTETITVVVEDEYGLTDVRTYTMVVDSTQHKPVINGLPPIQCVDANQPYLDSICVSDLDLGRNLNKEKLTLTVMGSGAGIFTLTPSTIDGTLNPDTCYKILIQATSIPDTGKDTVRIKVTDLAGNFDTLSYQIAISAPTTFSMPIEVRNTYPQTENRAAAFQRLTFGYARNATTGEEQSNIGQLDADFCEYELPPQPPVDVFDSRWVISGNAGTLRDIFPETPTSQPVRLVWKGSFQPGNLSGSGSNYPIVISWKMSDAQKSLNKDLYLTDPSESLFRVNMKNAQYKAGGGITVRTNGDVASVEIGVSTNLNGFKIIWDPSLSGVTEPTPGIADHSSYSLSPNVPNPFSQITHIGFNAPKKGAVKLEIFDIHGSLVKTLLQGDIEAGYHELDWNGTDESGRNVPSGTYTYRLSAGETVLSRTMILMK